MERDKLREYFTPEEVAAAYSDLNPLRIAEKAAFDRPRGGRDPSGKLVDQLDYRQLAIDRCAKAKLPMTSTHNCIYDLGRQALQAVCAYCQDSMHVVNGSGGDVFTFKFECLGCGSRMDVAVPFDGISVRPPGLAH
jgi:hypothetical protein